MTVFTNFAESTTELRNWLGIDGSLTPDLGDESHLWNATVLSPLDEGAAAHFSSDMVDSNGTIVTDPNFGFGLRNLIRYSDHLVLGATTNGTFAHPHPSDGTKSFIIGIILQIDAQSGTDLNINIMQYVDIAPLRGTYLAVVRDDSDEDQRIAGVTFWQDAPGFQSVASPLGAAAIGKPLLLLLNYDFAAGLQKMITPDGMVTSALVDLGDFTPSVIMKLGDPGILNWDGAEYTWAQMFMFGYDGALDAELSFANMIRFLSFSSVPPLEPGKLLSTPGSLSLRGSFNG